MWLTCVVSEFDHSNKAFSNVTVVYLWVNDKSIPLDDRRMHCPEKYSTLKTLKSNQAQRFRIVPYTVREVQCGKQDTWPY